MLSELIAGKLSDLPMRSGVYIMLDEAGKIIYVGKAVCLKNRVRQYFQNSGNKNEKVAAMVSKIADFNYIITNSEQDALVLESNLIKIETTIQIGIVIISAIPAITKSSNLFTFLSHSGSNGGDRSINGVPYNWFILA